MVLGSICWLVICGLVEYWLVIALLRIGGLTVWVTVRLEWNSVGLVKLLPVRLGVWLTIRLSIALVQIELRLCLCLWLWLGKQLIKIPNSLYWLGLWIGLWILHWWLDYINVILRRIYYWFWFICWLGDITIPSNINIDNIFSRGIILFRNGYCSRRSFGLLFFLSRSF